MEFSELRPVKYWYELRLYNRGSRKAVDSNCSHLLIQSLLVLPWVNRRARDWLEDCHVQTTHEPSDVSSFSMDSYIMDFGYFVVDLKAPNHVKLPPIHIAGSNHGIF